jgi:SAM-dependent methyltransferase
VFFDRDSVVRVIDAAARAEFDEFRLLSAAKECEAAGDMVASESLSPVEARTILNGNAAADDGAEVVTHPRVWFPSYVHEWPAEMLECAGELTLHLAEKFLGEGWGLKDATPFNILFDGTKPVFVDVLSFEERDPEDPIWRPYQQFVNTFLLPLIANKTRGLTLRSIFLANREGMDIQEAGKLFKGVSRFKRNVFSIVTLPGMLTSKAESKTDLYSGGKKMPQEQASFILRRSFSRLKKQLAAVSPSPDRQSKWTGYTQHNVTTIPAYMKAKQRFVENSIETLRPKHVLDVGCNTGYFSFFAARSGARVVGIDHDPEVLGQVFRDAREEGLDVLPLAVDIARPSPRLGWRNSEIPSFMDRAEGAFDLVMMLAVLHHILVQDRIPLRDVLKLGADLTTDALIIEFVPPSDPLFRRIARGRDHLHARFNESTFESAAREFFDIERKEPLPETDRVIYLLRIKGR